MIMGEFRLIIGSLEGRRVESVKVWVWVNECCNLIIIKIRSDKDVGEQIRFERLS